MLNPFAATGFSIVVMLQCYERRAIDVDDKQVVIIASMAFVTNMTAIHTSFLAAIIATADFGGGLYTAFEGSDARRGRGTKRTRRAGKQWPLFTGSESRSRKSRPRYSGTESKRASEAHHTYTQARSGVFWSWACWWRWGRWWRSWWQTRRQ